MKIIIEAKRGEGKTLIAHIIYDHFKSLELKVQYKASTTLEEYCFHKMKFELNHIKDLDIKINDTYIE